MEEGRILLFSSNKGERKKIVKGKKRVKSFAHRNENTAITLFHEISRSFFKEDYTPAGFPSELPHNTRQEAKNHQLVA